MTKINHQIFYSVTGNNYSWFENYLSNRKQCVVINNNENMSFQNIICGVPQGSLVGPLPFILNINDLKYVSNALDPIIYAEDKNLSISDKNDNTLFTKANLQRHKKNEWFKANILSLTTKNQCFFYTIKVLRKITCPWLFQY